MSQKYISFISLPFVAAIYLLILWLANTGALFPIASGLNARMDTQVSKDFCSPWVQVSDGAFGLPSAFSAEEPEAEQPFRGEEAFEVLVFKDQLYVGMEADNQLGARLWRTRRGVTMAESQTDWEEVISDKNGLPWGIENLKQVDHIDSLAAFKGYIYASTANSGSPTGTRVFRSPTGDPGTWEDVLVDIGPGFGKVQNENFKDMQVFEDQLCGGTWNEVDGTEVWCTPDGFNWQQVNESGFGSPENQIIWSGGVFNGAIYFGVSSRVRIGDQEDLIGRFYRTSSLIDNPKWDLVYQGESRSLFGMVLGELQHDFYIAAPSISGIRIYKSSSGDPGSWHSANYPGMDGSRLNAFVHTDGAVTYRDSLYLTVRNPATGAQIWRLLSDHYWQIVGNQADFGAQTFSASLIGFGDHLYAWTSNYAAGQAVFRTTCEYPSELPISGNPVNAAILLVVLTTTFFAAWLRLRGNRV